MWPWEHLAVAYLCCSVALRLTNARGPTDREALLVAAAGLLPDLIDKPLAWVLGVLPSGRSLGHSLTLALALGFVVGVAVWTTDRREASWVFGLAYLSHLAGDVVYPWVTRGAFEPWFLLWPFVSQPVDDVQPGAHLADLLAAFVRYLRSPEGWVYLGLEAALIAVCLWLWVRDGLPGTGLLGRVWRRRSRA